MADEDAWEDYETGPFCRHWGDPADCAEVCATCGHRCTNHEWEAPGECTVEGCECKEWKDKHDAL